MSGQVPPSYPTRRLPKQPSLEQLRKQAKELWEGYRCGDPTAVAEVGQYEWRTDPAAFALNDAQRTLARAYGYASWAKLKAFVDGVNIANLAGAVQAGDAARVRVLLNARPELINMEVSGEGEHRVLHYAVLRRDAAMVKLLMEAGAEARKGIYPHRDATSAFALARDREYSDIVAIIEREERERRAEMSCPNATISPVQDEINLAIVQGENEAAIRLLKSDGSLIQACDRQGQTPLHIAAQAGNAEMVERLLNRRAKVNKPDIENLTAIDRATLAAHPQNERAKQFPGLAKLLLEHGAEVTIRAAVALASAKRVRDLVEGKETSSMSPKNMTSGVVHEVPADLKKALTSDPLLALTAWEDITPLARNEWICWIESAKKAETRRRRIGWGCSSINDGKRRPCCWPRCAHR